MKYPNIYLTNKSTSARILLLAAAVLLLSVAISAQKIALGSYSLDQCGNGLEATPVQCTGAAWQHGDLNQSNSHWAESQFVSYRVVFDGLTPGPAIHTLVISFDNFSNDGAHHSLDYVGTYNFTENNADPCDGGATCTLMNGLTYLVPPDTATVTNQINPNTGAPVQQIPGVFTIWGGEIVGAAYTTPDLAHEQHLTITFTASLSAPVIAWGGHIAWIGDWGAGNSASTVNGSMYHMRIDALDGSGGNQDRSVKAAGVTQTGVVVIINEVATLDLTNTSTFQFPFTSTLNFGQTNFSLVDSNVFGPDRAVSQPISSFGAANTINVTEQSVWGFGWQLMAINCTELLPANSTVSIGQYTGTANIVVDPSETVTCTFSNSQYRPTAASVSISGRVLSSDSRAIGNALLILTDNSTGTAQMTRTSPFGFYAFADVPVGDTYVLTVARKGYIFVNSPMLIALTDDLIGVDFTATP